MKKLKVALLASLIASVSMGTAMADGIASDVVTATGDLVFVAQGTASISLTASTGLVAGPQTAGTQVASGRAEASDTDGSASIAIRWTPASGAVTEDNNLSTVIQIKGTNTPTNIANFKLEPSSAAGQMSAGNNGWIVPVTEDTTSLDFKITQKDAAVVNGDTYVLSVDAAVWAY